MAKNAPVPAPAVEAPALPMPTAGGCWVRLPDGTLARETPPAEEPAPPPAAQPE